VANNLKHTIMKTNSNTITQPMLLINSAHGQYIPQIFSEMIADHLKNQIRESTLDDLSNNENEHYWDAWAEILDQTFKTITGQKIYIDQTEHGDVWIIPACFTKTKEYKENWINY
jgi:hypothetical protein